MIGQHVVAFLFAKQADAGGEPVGVSIGSLYRVDVLGCWETPFRIMPFQTAETRRGRGKKALRRTSLIDASCISQVGDTSLRISYRSQIYTWVARVKT